MIIRIVCMGIHVCVYISQLCRDLHILKNSRSYYYLKRFSSFPPSAKAMFLMSKSTTQHGNVQEIAIGQDFKRSCAVSVSYITLCPSKHVVIICSQCNLITYWHNLHRWHNSAFFLAHFFQVHMSGLKKKVKRIHNADQ